MRKEKFHIEYVFDKVSRKSLWNQLTTGMGLSSWFADEVKIKNEHYVFCWNKEQQAATIVAIEPDHFVRFRWDNEEDPNAYFEFKLHTLELTGSTALEVTDFAEADDKSDSIDLWDSQVDDHKRSLGII